MQKSIRQTDEVKLCDDWFCQGKMDAWSGQAKRPPQDPEAASLYDLGYDEGIIQRAPT